MDDLPHRASCLPSGVDRRPIRSIRSALNRWRDGLSNWRSRRRIGTCLAFSSGSCCCRGRVAPFSTAPQRSSPNVGRRATMPTPAASASSRDRLSRSSTGCRCVLHRQLCRRRQFRGYRLLLADAGRQVAGRTTRTWHRYRSGKWRRSAGCAPGRGVRGKTRRARRVGGRDR